MLGLGVGLSSPCQVLPHFIFTINCFVQAPLLAPNTLRTWNAYCCRSWGTASLAILDGGNLGLEKLGVTLYNSTPQHPQH